MTDPQLRPAPEWPELSRLFYAEISRPGRLYEIKVTNGALECEGRWFRFTRRAAERLGRRLSRRHIRRDAAEAWRVW